MLESLFGEMPEFSPTASEKPQGPFAGVAIEKSLDRVLDYEIPRKLIAELRVGQRVKVPLGRANKPTGGYVVYIRPTTEYPKIKKLISIQDPRVLIEGKLMELARWMSRYYCAPLGTVIESVIPSAVKKKIGMDYTQVVRMAQPREAIAALMEKSKATKRRAVLARLLLLKDGEGIDIIQLAADAGVKKPSVRKLATMGVIAITLEMDLETMGEAPPSVADELDQTLNEDQQKVFDQLLPKMAGGFSVSLLHGVTGSGKTEVYLQSIRQLIPTGKQAIVLVPEIALTPQTVRRFTARFPRVAILHSGLAASQRHRYWQMIASGRVDVVVGTRSAIFAPVPNLGMIVVDEEHDSSYKQDTAPRYHARDVAIKRAQMEGVPIVLGSATPSLETWRKATLENVSKLKTTYQLLSLPNRVRGLSMPRIELVDMKLQAKFQRGIHLISQRLEHMLKNTIAAKHQAILLLNRRGYSSFVYCASCQDAVQCKFCDTTMTYHRSSGRMHCHYCLAENPLPPKCPSCGKLLTLFGLGTQRVEEELKKKLPDLRFERVDSDTMRSSKDYEQLLGRFARREIDVLLGTQMIAKGLDFPNVTLVGVISGDTALSLPDFRAAERTYQLITQVAGRAGRGDVPGHVILQTYQPTDPTIQAAIKQDYSGFAKSELHNRLAVTLPPFARMVRIILRDEDPQKLQKLCDALKERLDIALEKHPTLATMKGPMPCAISRIAGYHRNQIVLTSPRASILQQILAEVREKGGLAKSDRIAVDVDPVSLL